MNGTLRALHQRDAQLTRLLTKVRATIGEGPQLVIVSGLRRVGKTLLVRHLLDRLPAEMATVYFEATEGSEARELARFHTRLTGDVGADIPVGPAPSSWEQAFGLAAFAARQRPVCLVIDEVTYLMGSSPTFASELQAFWDRLAVQADAPRLALVLTGSEVGLIDDALSNRGALYQRPTLSIRLDPFSPAEAYRFCERPEASKLLEAYAACGGYPLHLEAWDFDDTTAGNLLRLAGTPGGVLIEDGNLSLARLGESARRVLVSVGAGRSRLSEIANEVGRPQRALEVLAGSRLATAQRPLGAPSKARPEYRIADTYLAFWFAVLADNVQLVEAGQGQAVLGYTAGRWMRHLGATFEDAARRHAAQLVVDGRLPPATLIGEWWTTSGQQAQIDVLGLGSDHLVVAAGEARWQRQPLAHHELQELAGRLRLAPAAVPQPTFLLYGRSGARPEVCGEHVLGFDAGDVLAS